MSEDKDLKAKAGSHDSILDPSIEATLIEVEDPLVGKSLGRYQILEFVAKGGTGTVYRALDTVLNREVAVKLLHEHLESRREVSERFKKEAMLIAQMRHPNILTVFDFFEYQGRAALVVEYMPGVTLSTLIKRTQKVPEDYVFMIASEILQGLKAAHDKGIIHRDIKPANVLLHPELGVKISDFGLAKVLAHDDGLTKQGVFVGTPSFSSPEQIEGKSVDQRTDIFSLGLTLYILATRLHAFKQKGDSTTTVWFKIVKGKFEGARQIDPTLSTDFERIVAKALQVDVDDRYPHAEAMLAEIEDVLKRRGLGAYQSKLKNYLKTPEKFATPFGEARPSISFFKLMIGVSIFVTVSLGYLWWLKERALDQQTESTSEPMGSSDTTTQSDQWLGSEPETEEPTQDQVSTEGSSPLAQAEAKIEPKVPLFAEVSVPSAITLPSKAVVVVETAKNTPGYRWVLTSPAKFELASRADFKKILTAAAAPVAKKEIPYLPAGEFFWRAGSDKGSLLIQTAADYKRRRWPQKRSVLVLSRFEDVDLEINPWTQDLRLDWTAGPQASSYKLEVATETTFTDLLFSGSLVEKSYKVQRHWPKDVSVYWRVSYQDERGNVFLVDPIRRINLKVNGQLGVFGLLGAEVSGNTVSVTASGQGSRPVKCATVGKSGKDLDWTTLSSGRVQSSATLALRADSRWIVCESQSIYWIRPLRR